MNKENVAKLVAALRSGEYKQATLKLRRDEGYCCLGVACDVSKLGKWEKGEYWHYVINDGVEVLESEMNLLPKTVAESLDIKEGGLFRYYYPNGREFMQWSLTELNDSYQFTFSQIADILESECLVFLKPGDDDTVYSYMNVDDEDEDVNIS